MEKTEAKIQQEIVMFVRNELREGIIFSVPNETESKMDAIRKKATGMMAGVSDLIYITENRVLFIETKTSTGRQGESQKKFQSKVEALGYIYILVRSLDDFKNMLYNIKITSQDNK